MEVKINNNKFRSIFLSGKWYDTNTPLDLSLGEALRLSTLTGGVEFKNITAPYNHELFKNKKQFAFMTNSVDPFSGWGNATINLLKFSQDYDITLISHISNVTEASVLNASIKPVDPGMAVVIHEQPKDQWSILNFEKKICIVPFETTRVPQSWIARINSCTALFTPCKQNIQMFRDSGVTIPIELIHWGVDYTKFYELERQTNRPFTFGTMGALSVRKGSDILMKAFEKAFPNKENVRLICKTSFNHFQFANRDKRIQIDMSPVSNEDLLNSFFKQIDCFVFPTRGEGFGLPPLEAAATGVPIIVTNWSGPVEYLNPDIGWALDYSMVPATDFTKSIYKEDCGDWADPSLEHLIQLMRYAFEHQDEVKQKGKVAAQYVRDNWLWKDKINMFHEALNKHL